MIALAAAVTLPTDAWAKFSTASWSAMNAASNPRPVAAVRRHHGEAARRGRNLARGLRRRRRADRAVQAAAALEQEPSVPASAGDREPDRIGLAVHADAPLDDAWARQFDGMATPTVAGSGGAPARCRLAPPALPQPFRSLIVEPGKPRPASASHLTVGVIAG